MKFIYYPLVLLWLSIFGQVVLWFGQAKYTLYKWIEKKVSCPAVPLVNIYHQSAWSRVWIFSQLNNLQHEFLKGFLDQGQQQSFWKLSTLSNLLDLQWSLPNKWNNYSFTTVCHAYLPRWQRWPAQKPSLKNVINHLERLL